MRETPLPSDGKNVLWISGRAPTPLFSGDALYSWGLIQAFAQVPFCVCVVGTNRPGSSGPVGQQVDRVEWITCPPRSGSRLRSLVSRMPKDAFLLASPGLCRAVQRLLNRDWSWIVIDHANSSGVLPILRAARSQAKVCYVAHNAEGLVRPAVAAATERPLRRLVMRLDAEKYRRIEIAALKDAHRVICISDEDAEYFSRRHHDVHVVPPVFLGNRREAGLVHERCPRALLLLGSFDWVAKQRNLEMIIGAMAPVFSHHGIVLHIVGTVPPALEQKLGKSNHWVRFHGQLADYSELAASCRGALLAEVLGGGFKLKTLDYAFMRLPVFALTQALAGMTTEERYAMFTARGLSELAKTIGDNIDNIGELNQRQQELYALVSRRFNLERAAVQISRIFGQPLDRASTERSRMTVRG